MNFLLKPKFLLWVIVILILVNIGTFLGVFFAHDHKESKEEQREKIFKKLGLTDNQRKTFVTTRDRFQNKNFPLYDRYDTLMIKLQSQVSKTPIDTATINHYADSLGRLNAQIRKNWIRYSIEVRKCLTPEQQKKYDIVTLEHLRSKMGR